MYKEVLSVCNPIQGHAHEMIHGLSIDCGIDSCSISDDGRHTSDFTVVSLSTVPVVIRWHFLSGIDKRCPGTRVVRGRAFSMLCRRTAVAKTTHGTLPPPFLCGTARSTEIPSLVSIKTRILHDALHFCTQFTDDLN